MISINIGISLFVSGILLFFSIYSGFDFIYHFKNAITNTTEIITKAEIPENSIDFVSRYIERGYKI